MCILILTQFTYQFNQLLIGRMMSISRHVNKSTYLLTKTAIRNYPGYLPMFHPSGY